ncbi:PaeR7I family type II restriction endonuclease [Glycomyces sp. NPDC046736]|uniref:PaeR7I family type II restriction endonuclease n=1 Tax=Glycomyces sp. NPDC046736 TaxID=3155615 RepID=UPI0033ED91B0
MAVTYDDFVAAVKAYWDIKDTQFRESAIAKAVGQGTAGSVRGGKHFDSIAILIAKFFVDAGYPKDSIRVSGRATLALPGYYRPQKQWDLVVAYEGTLVAAFELKALGGPSFGNNYNNRVEEALGSAVDLRRAELADTYTGEKPWLGYFFIMQDHPKSRSQVRIEPGSAFNVDAVWLEHSSYQDRFAVFCKRLIDEGLYDSVCYVTSSPEMPTPVEPSESLDWAHFSAGIKARLTYLHELGIPHQ